MNDIMKRLDNEIDKIKYDQKKEKGLLLNEEDLKIIFTILKSNDQELKPMLEILESLVLKLKDDDYLLMEKYINEILKYYKIVPNDDLILCRHKLFFTESKKLTKKNFFAPNIVEKIKDELSIQNIFKKL